MNEISTIRTPELIGAEIRTLTTQARYITLWYGIEIGRKLTEAKELLEHGEWLPFLQNQTEFSQPSASRFMRLFKEYGAEQGSLFGAESKYSTLNNLSISNALQLLAIPESEREEFAEEHDLEHKSSREVEELIQARKAAEEQKAELERRLDAQEQENKTAAEQIGNLTDRLKDANAEIRELKNRPIEVAVQRDEAAIERAATEAREAAEKNAAETLKKKEAEFNKQIGEARHGRKEAVEKLSAAEAEIEKLKAAEAELEELKSRAANADTVNIGKDERISELEKQLAMSAPAVTEFKLHFDMVQKSFAIMRECIEKLKESDGIAAYKLTAAAHSLLDKLCGDMEDGSADQ